MPPTGGVVISLIPMLFVSVAVGTAAAILAWRQRPEPGATPLVALLLGQSWWSACLIFRLRAPTVSSKLLWADLAWVGVVTIPVAWLLFSLEYTGHDEYIHLRSVIALSAVPLVTILLVVTAQYHNLLYVRPGGVGPDGVMIVHHGGVWYRVITGYTYLLGGTGMLAVLELLTSDAATFRSQGVALLVGLLAPWLTNALFLTDFFMPTGIDPTPISFSISGVAYLSAISRYRLFGTNPAPKVRARQLIFDRMQAGAIVVDTNDHIVDTNDSCEDIFGMDEQDILGAPADEIVPGYDRLPCEGALSGHLTINDETGEHPYDVTVTPISNVRGKSIGRVITFHDISRHLRQQQRLEVLNRILRHNIRTETNIIHGYVDRFADDEDAQTVKRRALRIEEMGRKGREAIQLFNGGREGHDSRPLSALLQQCLDSARREHPEVTFEYDPLGDDVTVAWSLRTVLSNVVENAVEHNTSDDPHVWVRVREADQRVHISVVDNGPGIDTYELNVLEDGSETALKHGSGLGLWIAKWGTEIAGGNISFSENNPTGSVVTVDVPILSRDGDRD
ncbi:histidine kinase N-terminal 7TM domain-containing protein [Halogeometricum borinquense]|nr:histidine kinase N-terminal 7TM domain-containing protein [Halogeometricum borinquense]